MVSQVLTGRKQQALQYLNERLVVCVESYEASISIQPGFGV
jgi:hypothetical protein